jgi:lipopolysaccharide transport system ATP-binding protein
VLMHSNSEMRVTALGLSKWYYSSGGASRISLQEAFRYQWNRLCGRANRDLLLEESPLQRQGPKAGTVWAVRDLSFEIRKGEVLGVIGPNGAGKSTLVRLLSRLTGPSAGEALIQGKSASVLEVGSGFHPDLTVRENALLNGVFLGMRRTEVEMRLPEILEFSNLTAYSSSPIKKLSQGMQYRLAVSVALHSDSEFLLLDEALEVTDQDFEEQCLEKIQSCQSEGKSFLFVSHNLSQIKKFSSRLLWLEEGAIKAIGQPNEVLRAYCQ